MELFLFRHTYYLQIIDGILQEMIWRKLYAMYLYLEYKNKMVHVNAQDSSEMCETSLTIIMTPSTI